MSGAVKLQRKSIAQCRDKFNGLTGVKSCCETIHASIYTRYAYRTLTASDNAARGAERRINITADKSTLTGANTNLQGRHSSHSILSTRYLGVECKFRLRQLNVHGIDDLLEEGNELGDSTETHYT